MFSPSSHHRCSSTTFGSNIGIVDAVQNFKRIACANVCLYHSNQGTYTVVTCEGATAVDDDILDAGIASYPTEKTNLIVVRSVYDKVLDGMELTIEITFEFVVFICANGCVVNTSHVNVVCQDNLGF